MRRRTEGHRSRRSPWWSADRLPGPGTRRLRWIGAVGVAVGLLYAWWATGLAPFTAQATVAVAVPVALVGVATLAVPGRPVVATPREAGGPAGRRWYPWAALAAVALAVEIAALVLGGRSAGVPTLSTVVDHALGRHPVRGVLFCGWMAVGTSSAVRAVRRWRREVA